LPDLTCGRGVFKNSGRRPRPGVRPGGAGGAGAKPRAVRRLSCDRVRRVRPRARGPSWRKVTAECIRCPSEGAQRRRPETRSVPDASTPSDLVPRDHRIVAALLLLSAPSWRMASILLGVLAWRTRNERTA
jgi:hypothetical protein